MNKIDKIRQKRTSKANRKGLSVKKRVCNTPRISEQSVRSVYDYFVKGIYFLYYEGKIVYVGKSNSNVMQRINSHYDDKRTLILKNQNKVHEVFRFWNEDVRDAPRKCAESLDFLLANL